MYKITKKNLSFIFFIGVFGVFSAQLSCAEDKIVIEYNPYLEICKEIKEILQLPENEEYLSIDEKYRELNPDRGDMFYIPERYTNFAFVKWEEVTEKEFADALPWDYQNLQKYLARENKETPGKFGAIAYKKTKVPLLDQGLKYELFLVDLGLYRWLYMNDEDWGVVKYFRDNFASTEPFYYKGRIYFYNNPGPHLFINELGPRRLNTIVNKICHFEAKEQ